MRKLTAVVATLGILGVIASAAPAWADDDFGDGRHRHEWMEHRWREHEWREHEWREHAWRHYAPPPIAYVAPGYYAAPPHYYVPPPTYYVAPPPPPPAVYGEPGFSVGFTVR